jgi:hypothetical protein
MKSTFETIWLFSQARRICGTTHFIRPCTILHAMGFWLPPNFEDCPSWRWIMTGPLVKKNTPLFTEIVHRLCSMEKTVKTGPDWSNLDFDIYRLLLKDQFSCLLLSSPDLFLKYIIHPQKKWMNLIGWISHTSRYILSSLYGKHVKQN